jgi:hypothetical protein
MARPKPEDYPAYFNNYISQVAEDDLETAFQHQSKILEKVTASVDEEKSKFAYAPGKWTIKEMWQHLIDAERVFNYRALCFARKETANLPSFDENIFAANSNANSRDWQSLREELENLSRSTNDLYKSFTEEMLSQKGIANNSSATVLSMAFTTIGHVNHHIKILKERYNISQP